MASSSSLFFYRNFSTCNCIYFVLILIFSVSTKHALGCYTSIFSFGDSLADTGNLLHISDSSIRPPHFALPPYGETYFHRPTGRCSDGRLIIDFIGRTLLHTLWLYIFRIFFKKKFQNDSFLFFQGLGFGGGEFSATIPLFWKREIGKTNKYKVIL